MASRLIKFVGMAALAAGVLCAPQFMASGAVNAAEKAHTHDHGSDKVYKGYFEDADIKDRTLADWQGDWQSLYPLLKDGTLDKFLEHKAKSGDKTVDQYREYYTKGYATDVDRIVIAGDKVTFYRAGKLTEATYADDGRETLAYKKGNRGVRYIFKKTSGDASMPQYIQFSDHRIAPEKSGHYHLFWGNDRAATLAELNNWPTYYPADLSREDVLHEMMEH
ncbi:ZinT family metal-binding protein [Rhizobium sp. C1]|uniref:ZinT family metal-binding protein n=1 Tax=Rhizobium sp. C1 TaxID=1349799 RepID=UPI001E52BBA8|nr:metal-binding protein ZinT [Rhizobium sp. C1]MCD2177671.1 metal-binding protein ZinT [Rhizobium sp. C1]